MRLRNPLMILIASSLLGACSQVPIKAPELKFAPCIFDSVKLISSCAGVAGGVTDGSGIEEVDGFVMKNWITMSPENWGLLQEYIETLKLVSASNLKCDMD